jgi:hypothetical protein
VLAGSPDLIEIELVEQRDQAHHADRITFPRRVEFLLLLEERRQRLAHEQDPVLRFLRPRHQIRRRRQVEELVRPHPAGDTPACLHLVENERHVVDARQQPQLAHEAGAGHAHSAFALNRFDQHRGDASRAFQHIRRQVGALRLEEFVEPGSVRWRLPRQELVDGIELAPVGVPALLRLRLPP